MKYELQPAFETSLTHKSYQSDMLESDGKIIVIQFEGKPGVGSEGNFDATYIIATIRTILEGCLPKAVVVDFGKVNYEFGNGMMKALDLTDEYGLHFFLDDFPHATVNQKSSNVLYRLMKILGFKKNEFNELEDAMLYVESEYKKLPVESGSQGR